MRVRQVRENKRPGWSQHRLAEQAGMDQAALCRIEGGRVRPNIETVVNLADALGVSVEELFERVQR